MTDNVLRAALLLRTCMEMLRDAPEPMPSREVYAEMARRFEPTPYEAESMKQGHPRWKTHFGYMTGDAATIGWLTKTGGWSLTEAGAAALDAFPGDSLIEAFRRQFQAVYRRRKQAVEQLGGAEDAIYDALSLVSAGFWTTPHDLAAVAGVKADDIPHFLAKVGHPSAYRVLTMDGVALPEGQRHASLRGTNLQGKLQREGVEFDSSGHASTDQRLNAEGLRERLAEIEPDDTAVAKRAWLVRGSSVEGRDLVPVWLRKGSMSLAASKLPPIAPLLDTETWLRKGSMSLAESPLDTETLKSLVDEHYGHLNSNRRQEKVAEYDAFCNRMHVGDLVLTSSQGKGFVGQVTGEAEYVASGDGRSNLRRTVEWLNDTHGVPFAKLPAPLPAKLSAQTDIVDLTEDLAAFEQLLNEWEVTLRDEPPAEPLRPLAFKEIEDAFADSLMIGRGWLQKQVDLLWNRRQLIFYGPPGTGKTYLARRIAGYLAEPSAVKLVQFHPSYTYEDFFEGFRPMKGDDGALKFDLKDGPFRLLVDDARQHPSDPYVLIIDEINRANLAKVFGELYFLLEYRDDAISLLYSPEKSFTLPPNVFIIGTMNTTDRSIALVDAAMRRRFAFVELHPSQPPTSELLGEWLRRRTEEGKVTHHADAAALLDALNATIEERDLAIGPSFLMHEHIYEREDALAEVWETSILPLLEEHHYGSPREILDRYRLDTLRRSLSGGAP